MLEISSWRTERRAFNRIRCTPPEGEDLAEVIIDERVRPLATLRTLVAERFGVAPTEPAQQLSTAEGELGAVINIDTAPIHHTFGVIYGDDFQTIVAARTPHLNQRDRIRNLARELVVHFPLGLGHKRQRRFWYRPPAGWQGLVRGLVTDWFPLDHPQNPATIKVLPARPFNTMFQLDTMLHDDTFTHLTINEVTRTALALGAFKGTLGRAIAGERAFLTAALEDQHFVYVLRLSTMTERLAVDEVIFQDMLKSCVPVPLPFAERSSPLASQASDYWTT
jgi:hypothetical protein